MTSEGKSRERYMGREIRSKHTLRETKRGRPVRNKAGTTATLDRMNQVGDTRRDRGNYPSEWGSRLIRSRGMKWAEPESVNERREYIARASGHELGVKTGAGWGTRDPGVELGGLETKTTR